MFIFGREIAQGCRHLKEAMKLHETNLGNHCVSHKAFAEKQNDAALDNFCNFATDQLYQL